MIHILKYHLFRSNDEPHDLFHRNCLEHIIMDYSIIGFGAVGQALARAFARKNIEVAVASRRPPEALLPQAQAIGPTVVPKTLEEAVKANVIFLAVLFEGHREVAKNLASWQGKTIIDAMNGFGVSSAVVAKAFPGAQIG